MFIRFCVLTKIIGLLKFEKSNTPGFPFFSGIFKTVSYCYVATTHDLPNTQRKRLVISPCDDAGRGV